MTSTSSTSCMKCGQTVVDVPTSPVAHLLHTNGTPSFSERALIDDTIINAQSTLSQLDDQLKDFMRTYRQKRKAIHEYVDSHRALLSQERRVPAEILSAIFVRCLPERWQEHSVSSSHTLATPLLLSQVCSYWRNVCIATPTLWSSFHLRLTGNPSEKALDRQKTWLSRNGGVQLSMMIEALEEDFDMSTHPMTELLMSQCDRWRHLVLNMSFAALTGLAPVKHHLGSLRTLSINPNPNLDINELWLSPDTFELAPHLHTVELGTGALAPQTIKLPWGQLTRCSTRAIYAVEALEMLQQSPGLIECDIELLNRPGDFSTYPSLVELSHLRSLHLHTLQETAITLDYLTLPSLVNFEVKLRGFLGNGWGLHSHFSPLMSRSSCSLQRLVIELAYANMQDEDLIQCLGAVPSLVEIILRFQNCRGSISDKVLNCLNPLVSQDILVPKLEKIEFDLFQATCTNQALVGMLQSRRKVYDTDETLHKTPVARLKSVKLSSVSFQFDAVTHARLEEMVEDGFYLNITDKRPF